MWNERFKISFLIGGLAVFIGIILLRLFYLQTVKHEFYNNYSKKQSLRRISLNRDRGTIFDINGVVLAENMKVASLYAYGKDVKSRSDLRRTFLKYGIKLNNKTMRRLSQTKGFVWLKRGVDIGKAQRIAEVMKNVNFVINESRFYPEKSLASGVIGFTGVDNQGLHGVEIGLDNELKGEKVEIISLRDSRGKFILSEDKRGYEKPLSDLYLTIDSKIQSVVEAIIADDIKEFRAKKAIAVAMDIKTGDILFGVTSPRYDPNEFRKYSKESWKTGITHYLFEPGSIFKPVTFSYLIQNGLNLNEKVNCENGRYRVYNHVIKDVHKYKMLTAEEVLVLSSNIGTVKLIDSTNKRDFYNYLRKAGFGNKTGISGLTEEAGFLRDSKKWSGLSKPSISIGQELLVTPLQILRFYAAIANGGKLIIPQIVADIKGSNSFKKKTGFSRIMDEESARKMRDILGKVVSEGTGKKAGLNFIKIAGKTGTGQKFDVVKGVYSKSNYVAGFAGFFPVEKPEIALLVLYDSPGKSIYGGSTAAISFKKIIEQIAIIRGMNIKTIRIANAS